MTKFRLFIILVLIIIFTNIADAGSEVRGAKATGAASWNAQIFAGLWYDIDADKSTETLTVRGSIGDSNRFIEAGNLQYNTFATSIPYRLYAAKGLTVDGKSSYYTIGWQGEKYIAVNGKANKLAKLVLEQDSSDSKVLSVGQTWDMGDGYTLAAQSIDAKASSPQAWIVLSKDGIKLDDKVIARGQVYSYRGNIAGEINSPIFVAYANSIYAGPTSDVIELKYSWLISKSVTTIQTGDKFGVFRVSSANENNIALLNEAGVMLQKGAVIDLFGNLKFDVADNDRLVYYPVIRLQDLKNYTIRGEIAKGAASWSAQNFAGFWYDLDSDQSTETLSISGSINNANRFIEANSLIYRTSAVPVSFKVTKAKGISVGGNNYYKAVGWQGDKYIAINGKSNKLTKILLEQGYSTSEKKTLTVGETWDMGNGYTITAQSIDAKASPRQAWLVFSKNGKKLNDKVVSQGQLYTYEANFGDDGYVPILVTYLDSVFAGATSDMIQLRYALLASDSAGNIRLGERFGVLEVTDSNDNSVILTNKNRIPLSSGIVDLLGDMKFKVANDASNLRFYPMIELTPFNGESETFYSSTIPSTYAPTYTSGALSTYPTSMRSSDNSSNNSSIYTLLIILGIILTYIFKSRKTPTEVDKQKPKIPVKMETKTPIIVKPLPKKIENTYTLIVEVKNWYNKTPIQRATIILEQQHGEAMERISDIDGKVIFGKVNEGPYKLRIASKGYEENNQEFEINKNSRLVVELKGKATLNISALDAVNERPLIGAEIKLGDMVFKTDDKGEVVISDIAIGNHILSVHGDSYKAEELSLDVNEAAIYRKIYLQPEIKLDEEFLDIGNALKHSLNESMKKLSSACDMCIPEYYKSICSEIIRLNETVAKTPVYIYSDSSKERIYTLYFVAERICKEIETVLTNEENITDYINMGYKGYKKNASTAISFAEYNQIIHLFMTDPKEFIEKNKKDIFNKLQYVDQEITHNLQNYNVSSTANLWHISQKIIQTEIKDESTEAASLLLGNILLDKTREMLKNEEITKRIRK